MFPLQLNPFERIRLCFTFTGTKFGGIFLGHKIWRNFSGKKFGGILEFLDKDILERMQKSFIKVGESKAEKMFLKLDTSFIYLGRSRLVGLMTQERLGWKEPPLRIMIPSLPSLFGV